MRAGEDPTLVDAILFAIHMSDRAVRRLLVAMWEEGKKG